MGNKTKYIILWYVNWLFLALGLFFFVLFLVNRDVVAFRIEIVYLTLFLTFLVLYAVVARVCNRALQCEGGYSLIQAVYFYIACEQAGYRGTTAAKDVHVLQKVAAKRDALQALDKNELQKCYHLGKATIRSVNAPLLKSRWIQRSKNKKR